MLTIIAEILTTSELALQAVIESFKEITPTVLQEDGCYCYELYVDSKVDSQIQHKSAYSMTMYEKWETIQHLETHMRTAHMLAHQTAVESLVIEVKIKILERGFDL